MTNITKWCCCCCYILLSQYTSNHTAKYMSTSSKVDISKKSFTCFISTTIRNDPLKISFAFDDEVRVRPWSANGKLPFVDFQKERTNTWWYDDIYILHCQHSQSLLSSSDLFVLSRGFIAKLWKWMAWRNSKSSGMSYQPHSCDPSSLLFNMTSCWYLINLNSSQKSRHLNITDVYWCDLIPSLRHQGI